MDPMKIRELFLAPKASYALSEAAALLDMRARDLRGWLEAGELEAVTTKEGLVLPWSELVSFVMDFVEQEEIERALGVELADAIPELLRLTDLAVRIPRMEVVALEQVAGREGKSVDAVLARELLDFVSAHSDWLSVEIPGLAEALSWPDASALAP